MKKCFTAVFLVCFITSQAQIGVKAGLNFANITNASMINHSSRSGFHFGGFLGTGSGKLFGFRTELIYSSQGYNYKSGTNNNDVKLNYILLPQLFCVNITKYIQIQAGGQAAFLLSASNDSTMGSGSILDYAKRIDFGLTGGFELHPIKKFLIGARINYSFGKVFKDLALGMPRPSFLAYEAKNNVVQIFAGLKLGK